MKKTLLLLIVLATATASAAALAQSAPLRGAGLLALNTTESPACNNANTVVDASDSGGGSTGARAMRGSDATPHAAMSIVDSAAAAELPDDPLPAKTIGSGDPAAPAAATPKRPSYRWQSLVPGAIK
jgi:hypothetical protein